MRRSEPPEPQDFLHFFLLKRILRFAYVRLPLLILEFVFLPFTILGFIVLAVLFIFVLVLILLLGVCLGLFVGSEFVFF